MAIAYHHFLNINLPTSSPRPMTMGPGALSRTEAKSVWLLLFPRLPSSSFGNLAIQTFRRRIPFPRPVYTVNESADQVRRLIVHNESGDRAPTHSGRVSVAPLAQALMNHQDRLGSATSAAYLFGNHGMQRLTRLQ